MAAGILRKLPRLLVVLLLVSALTFLLTSLLPGDPARQLLGPAATPAQVALKRHQLHLDEPLYRQYFHWLGGALHFDFGRFYVNNEPVRDAIKQRLPVTVELLVLAQLIALAVAIPLGIWSAYRSGRRTDRVITTTSFAFLSIPDFCLAIFLVFLLAVRLRAFQATGFVHLTDSMTGNLKSLVLPAITLAAGIGAVYIRLLRTDMIATLQEDFILMARAEGLPTRQILVGNALRPSSFTLLTVAGINTGALIGGAVIVEYLFALPGMGSLLVDSVGRNEYLVVQGVVLVLAAGYVLVNFLVDALYSVLDPRVRHA